MQIVCNAQILEPTCLNDSKLFISKIYKVGDNKILTLGSLKSKGRIVEMFFTDGKRDTSFHGEQLNILMALDTSFINYAADDPFLIHNGFIYFAGNKAITKFDFKGKFISRIHTFEKKTGYISVHLRSIGNYIFFQYGNNISKFKNDILNPTYYNGEMQNDKLFDFHIYEKDSSIFLIFKTIPQNGVLLGKIMKYNFDGKINSTFKTISIGSFSINYYEGEILITDNQILKKYDESGVLDTAFNVNFNNGFEPYLVFKDLLENYYLVSLLGDIYKLDKFGVLQYFSYGYFPLSSYDGFINDKKELILAGGFSKNFSNSSSCTIIKIPLVEKLPCNALSLNITKTEKIKCNSKGYVLFSASGGLGQLTYLLDDTIALQENDTLFFTQSGFHKLKVKDDYNCEITKQFFIDEYTSLQYHDVSSTLAAETFERGFESKAWLTITNRSCKDVNATATLKLPNNVQLINAFPAPSITDNANHIYKWNISDLNDKFTIPLTLKTSANAALASSLDIIIEVNPLENDIAPNNNIKTYTYTVFGSYDPNDITNNPSGKCNAKYIKKDEALSYTIRFQNIGNFPAKNIFVMDSLPDALDINSIKILASSHEMVTEKIGQNSLKFLFPNINLAGKEIDEAKSHGYVVFEIKLKPSAPSNTTIKNKAEIFFDFNTGVITNEVFNTLIDEIPHTSFTDNIEKCIGDTVIIDNISYSSNQAFQSIYTSGNGCDSIVQHIINFRIPEEISHSYNTCEKQINIVGKQISKDTTFQITYNCDSVVTYIIKFEEKIVTTQALTVCYGSQVSVYNIVVTSDTIIVIDSFCNVVNVKIDVLDKLDVSLTKEVNSIIGPIGYATYKWYDCNNGQYFTDANTNIFTPNYSGEFKLGITDVNGCQAFSACTQFTTSTFDDPGISKNIVLYPNPSNGLVYIKTESNLPIESISISNLLGETISIIDQAETNTLPISLNLAKGIYFVKIKAMMKTYYRKIVIE